MKAILRVKSYANPFLITTAIVSLLMIVAAATLVWVTGVSIPIQFLNINFELTVIDRALMRVTLHTLWLMITFMSLIMLLCIAFFFYRRLAWTNSSVKKIIISNSVFMMLFSSLVLSTLFIYDRDGVAISNALYTFTDAPIDYIFSRILSYGFWWSFGILTALVGVGVIIIGFDMLNAEKVSRRVMIDREVKQFRSKELERILTKATKEKSIK